MTVGPFTLNLRDSKEIWVTVGPFMMNPGDSGVIWVTEGPFTSFLMHFTTRIKKKAAPFCSGLKETEKIISKFSCSTDFEDS